MAETKFLFPALTPTGRTYTPGKRPETIFESQNGAVTFVQFGNQPVNAKLQLQFSNITDADAFSILDHFNAMTENNWVEFGPRNGLGGMDGVLLNAIPDGNDAKVLRWRYAQPPTVTSVFPGVSSVSCDFIGYFFGA